MADFARIADLWATFPRGEGLFFHLGKLIGYIVIYLGWVKFVAWLDRDAKTFGMPSYWTPIAASVAFLSLLSFWIFPVYWLSVVLSLLLLLSPLIIYSQKRNEEVPPALTILTVEHVKRVARRNFGLKIGSKSKDTVKTIPVKFLGKAGEGRGSQAEGYRGAQELIWLAVQRRSTDIHMEPTRDGMQIRFRIDGILQPVKNFDTDRGTVILNVYKNLAALDIAEKRKPQDGSFSAEVEERTVDFRVATSGSIHGEKMVIRLLDSSRQMKSLAEVGLREILRRKIEPILDQSNGLLITCGPTGAGKTSTLYACLNQIDRLSRNVITLENPVEYMIDNVTQIEVNTKAGKTFAAELRSMLRQDPDVILVGEVRDAETAEIACQAAQTGHLVLTTLHANDAVTALGRLIDLGVKPFLVASSVTAIVSQRLVRVLCPKCRVPCDPVPEVVQRLKLPAGKGKFFKPTIIKSSDKQACSRCQGMGYLGRTGIFELLVLTDEIRALLKENPDLGAIRQVAMKSGYFTLMDDGYRKVAEGITTLEEIQRAAS